MDFMKWDSTERLSQSASGMLTVNKLTKEPRKSHTAKAHTELCNNTNKVKAKPVQTANDQKILPVIVKEALKTTTFTMEGDIDNLYVMDLQKQGFLPLLSKRPEMLSRDYEESRSHAYTSQMAEHRKSSLLQSRKQVGNPNNTGEYADCISVNEIYSEISLLFEKQQANNPPASQRLTPFSGTDQAAFHMNTLSLDIPAHPKENNMSMQFLAFMERLHRKKGYKPAPKPTQVNPEPKVMTLELPEFPLKVVRSFIKPIKKLETVPPKKTLTVSPEPQQMDSTEIKELLSGLLPPIVNGAFKVKKPKLQVKSKETTFEQVQYIIDEPKKELDPPKLQYEGEFPPQFVEEPFIKGGRILPLSVKPIIRKPMIPLDLIPKREPRVQLKPPIPKRPKQIPLEKLEEKPKDTQQMVDSGIDLFENLVDLEICAWQKGNDQSFNWHYD